jgi:hypothetical protein
MAEERQGPEAGLVVLAPEVVGARWAVEGQLAAAVGSVTVEARSAVERRGVAAERQALEARVVVVALRDVELRWVVGVAASQLAVSAPPEAETEPPQAASAPALSAPAVASPVAAALPEPP